MAKTEKSEAGLPVAVLTPIAMVEKALASGANVEVMEKLLALQERWEANQARKAFNEAIAEVRGELKTIIKGETANRGTAGGTYRYEDLSAVTEAVNPVLAEHGLSYRWKTASTKDSATITCVLSHRDGHSEESSLTGPYDSSGGKNPIQSLGSTVSYLQRYTLKAVLGLAAAADDDGNGARSSGQSLQNEGKQQKPEGQATTQPAQGKTFALTMSHNKLKALIDGYVKREELTPDYFTKILIRLTTWKDKEGKIHDGIGELNRISEKMAQMAIKKYNEKMGIVDGKPRQN